MKLVSTNMAATTNNTMPKVPVITFVKYKMPITTAIISLIILSAEPMFFFIVKIIYVNEIWFEKAVLEIIQLSEAKLPAAFFIFCDLCYMS